MGEWHWEEDRGIDTLRLQLGESHHKSWDAREIAGFPQRRTRVSRLGQPAGIWTYVRCRLRWRRKPIYKLQPLPFIIRKHSLPNDIHLIMHRGSRLTHRWSSATFSSNKSETVFHIKARFIIRTRNWILKRPHTSVVCAKLGWSWKFQCPAWKRLSSSSCELWAKVMCSKFEVRFVPSQNLGQCRWPAMINQWANMRVRGTKEGKNRHRWSNHQPEQRYGNQGCMQGQVYREESIFRSATKGRRNVRKQRKRESI